MSTPVKTLLIAAMAILLLFGIGHYFGFSTQSKEPRSHVMQLDTTAVAAIHFEDRHEARNDLLLRRTAEGWQRTAPREPGVSPADQARELLERFHELKVKRTMGMILLLGERYHLTDITLARITFTLRDGGIEMLNIGSDTFAPGKVGAWTYVNVPGEKEVYAVEGLLALGLRMPAEDL